MRKIRNSLFFLVCIMIIVHASTKAMWSRVLLAAAGFALLVCVIHAFVTKDFYREDSNDD